MSGTQTWQTMLTLLSYSSQPDLSIYLCNYNVCSTHLYSNSPHLEHGSMARTLRTKRQKQIILMASTSSANGRLSLSQKSTLAPRQSRSLLPKIMGSYFIKNINSNLVKWFRLNDQASDLPACP